MNDCPNAEIRDQLPDLLHERLDASARAVVVAHVATCVDCRDELQLLREMRGMLEHRAPRVDVAYVLGGLPKAPVSVARSAPRRRTWSDWRIAAAVTVLVAGGSSAVLLNRGSGSPSVAVSPSAPVASAATPSVSPAAPTRAAAAPAESPAVASAPATERVASGAENATSDRAADAVGGGNRLSDLSADQLQTLLKDIDKLQAVPVTDPDPVTLRINSQASSTEGA